MNDHHTLRVVSEEASLKRDLRMSPKHVIFPCIRWKNFKSPQLKCRTPLSAPYKIALLEFAITRLENFQRVSFQNAEGENKTVLPVMYRVLRSDKDLTAYVTVLSVRALQDKNTPSTFSTEAKIGAIYSSERLGHSYQNIWRHNAEDQSAITYSVHFPYK